MTYETSSTALSGCVMNRKEWLQKSELRSVIQTVIQMFNSSSNFKPKLRDVKQINT